MKRPARAYLDLIRLPNVVTAVADALAGFLYAGGGLDELSVLLRLAAASGCLYAGGVALNDVCDARRDALERPKRPIPAGLVSPRQAISLSVALLLGGFAFASSISLRSSLIALALVVAIVLYDFALKSTPVAPALMGLCRALNLMLAMHGAENPWDGKFIVPVVLMWCYVTSVTFFARDEARVKRRLHLALGTMGTCGAVAALGGLRWFMCEIHDEFLALVALVAAVIGYRGYQAVNTAEPARVQRAVRTYVISLIGFDACLTCAARGPIVAMMVAAMVVPALVLSRALRVT